MDDFYGTEAGQFIAGAHRYLSAAHILRYSDDAAGIQELLKTPVLHLAAHGMELLFKYPLIRSGQPQFQISKTFGHNLEKLWHADANDNLRMAAFESAERAWSSARDSGDWVNDDFSQDPRDVIVKAVGSLSVLHGKESAFALRYTIRGPQPAPRAGFLIDTFGDLAERTVMNPNYIDLHTVS